MPLHSFFGYTLSHLTILLTLLCLTKTCKGSVLNITMPLSKPLDYDFVRDFLDEEDTQKLRKRPIVFNNYLQRKPSSPLPVFLFSNKMIPRMLIPDSDKGMTYVNAQIYDIHKRNDNVSNGIEVKNKTFTDAYSKRMGMKTNLKVEAKNRITYDYRNSSCECKRLSKTAQKTFKTIRYDSKKSRKLWKCHHPNERIGSINIDPVSTTEYIERRDKSVHVNLWDINNNVFHGKNSFYEIRKKEMDTKKYTKMNTKTLFSINLLNSNTNKSIMDKSHYKISATEQIIESTTMNNVEQTEKQYDPKIYLDELDEYPMKNHEDIGYYYKIDADSQILESATMKNVELIETSSHLDETLVQPTNISQSNMDKSYYNKIDITDQIIKSTTTVNNLEQIEKQHYSSIYLDEILGYAINKIKNNMNNTPFHKIKVPDQIIESSTINYVEKFEKQNDSSIYIDEMLDDPIFTDKSNTDNSYYKVGVPSQIMRSTTINYDDNIDQQNDSSSFLDVPTTTGKSNMYSVYYNIDVTDHAIESTTMNNVDQIETPNDSSIYLDEIQYYETSKSKSNVDNSFDNYIEVSDQLSESTTMIHIERTGKQNDSSIYGGQTLDRPTNTDLKPFKVNLTQNWNKTFMPHTLNNETNNIATEPTENYKTTAETMSFSEIVRNKIQMRYKYNFPKNTGSHKLFKKKVQSHVIKQNEKNYTNVENNTFNVSVNINRLKTKCNLSHDISKTNSSKVDIIRNTNNNDTVKLDMVQTVEEKKDEHKIDEQKINEHKTDQQKIDEQIINEQKIDEHMIGEQKIDKQKIDEQTNAKINSSTFGLYYISQIDLNLDDDDRSVADNLAEKVRILCWVLTHPSNHAFKAVHVKATWGKRCNVLLFMSSELEPRLPTVKLQVEEGADFLWGKTKAAIEYIYENHRNDADWFLKADDDTYIIMENLRYMLSQYNRDDLLYTGRHFKLTEYSDKLGYMSGGAGYVLSRGALIRLYEEGLPNPRFCLSGNFGSEDLLLGLCLQKLGVQTIDSRDSNGRARFFPFPPEDHLLPKRHVTERNWFRKRQVIPDTEGIGCISQRAISFHYLNSLRLYEMEYLLYYLRPYGIDFDNPVVTNLYNYH